MNIISFFKKIIFPSSNHKEEIGRDEIELANFPVEQEHLSMNLELPPALNDEDSVSISDSDPKTPTEENDNRIEPIKDIQDSDRPLAQQSVEETNITGVQTQQEDGQDESDSLLDNSNYMSIVESLTSLMQEIEDEEDLPSQEVADLVKSRIQEGLLLSGAELISEDKEFDAIRHIPVPAAMVKPGTPIKKIIEPGIVVGNRVIRKAKVIIKS